jgi:thioredoxin-like negative regulator of GroEL
MYTLVDFYSDSCRPCIMMGPIVEQIVSQVGGVGLEKVNIAVNNTRANYYGVTAVPTFILLNSDGVEISRKIGAVPAPIFKNWIMENVS